MGIDGRDESQGDGDAEAGGPVSPQVPSQGGRSFVDDSASAGAGIPAQGGEPVEGNVPAQRDRREDSALPVPRELPPSDGDLIARMRAGDDTAYEELYRRHAGAVRRYARTCCRDAHTADDLTAEVFARMLQAVRGGSGPEHAVRAYLLTTIRRVAAGWTKSARREHLVDDFAVFAAQATRASEVSDDAASGGFFGAGLDLGADVRAMHEAEQSMAMRAFRSLPERWQAVLWHTEVEDESPSEVATLFGLDANGTRVLASRAREGLKQAYLQAHVSATLAGDEECARYADRLGAYARGGLRTRAERGLRKHLEECAKCRLAAGQIKDVASGIPAVVPVAVIGWFGAAGYAKVAALIAGSAGAGAAGVAGTVGGAGAGSGGANAGSSGAAGAGSGGANAGSSGAAGAGSGGANAGGGGAGAEGLGAPLKAGIAAGVAAVAAAAVVLALIGHDSPERRPDAKPRASSPVVRPESPKPTQPNPTPSKQTPGPRPPAMAPVAASRPTHTPKPGSSTPPSPARPTSASKPSPAPTPTPTSAPSSTSAPGPAPTPPPPPAVYQWSELSYDLTGDGTEPEMRLGGSTWVWQRYGVTVADEQYAHGVTVHGRSSVTIDLNRECTAYDALVGVDDLTLGPDKVHFSVYADGAPLWQSGMVQGGDRAVPVHVNLAGHRTVRLVVEPHGHLDALALADWAESRFSCS
jgi:RNA polymerase sigma factor (sigma-70 family)